MDKKPKNPICIIKWRDAAYSFDGKIKDVPLDKITTGFIVEANDEFVNITTTVDYENDLGKISPKDGYIIPRKTIIDFRKIGDLNQDE